MLKGPANIKLTVVSNTESFTSCWRKFATRKKMIIGLWFWWGSCWFWMWWAQSYSSAVTRLWTHNFPAIGYPFQMQVQLFWRRGRWEYGPKDFFVYLLIYSCWWHIKYSSPSMMSLRRLLSVSSRGTQLEHARPTWQNVAFLINMHIGSSTIASLLCGPAKL